MKKTLTQKDKKNISRFVGIWLDVHKKEADAFLEWKKEQKFEKMEDFNLSLKVPAELAEMLTREYPKIFEKENIEWFKKEFDIFTIS